MHSLLQLSLILSRLRTTTEQVTNSQLEELVAQVTECAVLRSASASPWNSVPRISNGLTWSCCARVAEEDREAGQGGRVNGAARGTGEGDGGEGDVAEVVAGAVVLGGWNICWDRERMGGLWVSKVNVWYGLGTRVDLRVAIVVAGALVNRRF